MKYYTIVFPGEFGQHVQETWNREQILKFYWASWNRKMFQSGNSDLVSEDHCVEDWITTHWATETDEFGKTLQTTRLSLYNKPVLEYNQSMNKTLTRSNLQYCNFDQYVSSAKTLGLTLKSFRVENDSLLSMTFTGSDTIISLLATEEE